MAEPVRLVVWDLDETFWRGTLVEGGIREYVQAHHDIVVELARRGILSSICSKNDEQSVVKILEERKILDYFVFPDISWDPKGPRLAALIEAVQLRPATVMFIDDNPHNLAEAKALIPDLQLENEKFVPKLLADPRFVGKDDSDLSRLKQYKLLESRREAQQSAGGGGHQFLRDSDIRVCFDHDLEDVANLDRAIELINRTNQLNYTKRRLPEDLEAARRILRLDAARNSVQAGLIRVVDRYGDYGYVGFFMTRNRIDLAASGRRELVHFCFSCRTLGMLIERWVYDYLERPKLEVVGEVLTDLSGPDVVDWVRLVSSFSDRKAEVAAIAPELRLYGGCEMYAIGLYLKQHVPEVKVRGSFVANNKFILLNSCALAVSAFDRTESEFSEEAKALGVPADVLAGDYFADAPPGTAIVFSGALDAGRFPVPYYQHAHHGWELAFELADCWDVTTLPEGAFERLVEGREGFDERIRLHLTGVARHVRRNYITARPMSDGRRAATLRALLEHVPVGAKFILLLDHDRQRRQGVVQPDPRVAHYNELVRSIVREYPYTQAVCFSDFVDDDEQVLEGGNHYHRVVYLKLAERLAESIKRLPRKHASDRRGQEIVDAEASSDRTSTANCGSPDELLPPEELQRWVEGPGIVSSKAIDVQFLGYLVDLCGLQPGDAVLDVGCGSGRIAVPLTGYLNHKGRYAGFDVSREAIAWCTENISGSHPNFDFRVADIQNGAYNPKGKCTSSEFRFPYPDGSFDVVLLASLFTHMLPPDVEHYLHEVVRVLKPGGRSLITFYLLNEESSALIKDGKGLSNFEHEMQGYRTTKASQPEAAIAYPEAFVRDLYEQCGLELREPLRYGKWCGRTDGMSAEDVVIAVKASSRNRLAQGVHMTDLERPKGSTKHPLMPLSDENIAVAEDMDVNPAATPVSGASKRIPRMSPAAAEEYIASLYATVLKRDPTPEEFAHWVTTAAAMPPEQIYFAFVNSKEYKLRQYKSVPTKFSPGHYYSPVVDPSTIAEYVEKQYLQKPGDIKGVHFDEDAMVRFWKENAEFIKSTPFSEHDDGKNRYYYHNGMFNPPGDAIMLRAMIGHFKPKNVIEVGSGFSSACMLDAVDHVGLSDFTLTCVDPNADRLRSRLREEDHSRVDIIEGLVQDVPVSTFAKLNENDILFIDSTHVLKTASDVHYELFSILPSLNKGVLVHFHDIQYPFEYPRQWLFEDNKSWNEIYALRAFLMYNSAFEVVFWNGLFAHRQRELVRETNPLFLRNPGGSIWLRVLTRRFT